MANKYLDKIISASYESISQGQYKTRFEVKFKLKNFAGKKLCRISRAPGLNATTYIYEVDGCVSGMPVNNNEVDDTVYFNQSMGNAQNTTEVIIKYTENGQPREDKGSMATAEKVKEILQ